MEIEMTTKIMSYVLFDTMHFIFKISMVALNYDIYIFKLNLAFNFHCKTRVLKSSG